MKIPRSSTLLYLAALVLLPGCLVSQSGTLEVLNPKQAYGRSVAVVGDLHRENEDIEKRLASDLRQALSKRGIDMADDPSDAEIVIVPTLGRMRERIPQPVEPVGDVASEQAGEPVESAEPVVAAPVTEARPFNRFSSGSVISRGDLVSRRAVPSARTPPSAQQAGLLLTGYRGEDFRDYGTGRQSLPPVWRIYVSQPVVQMKWNSVAVPLINAAANAARPLGKSGESGAENPAREEKREEQVADQAEPRAAGDRFGNKDENAGNESPDTKPDTRRKFLGLFGLLPDRDKKKQEPERPEADEPR